MYRYEIFLYGSKYPMTTYSVDNNNINGHWSEKYLQILGFIKKGSIYSIWDLNENELEKLKYSNPVLIRTNGTTKILTTKVKEVERVKL